MIAGQGSRADFRSDNTAGALPAVLEALTVAAMGRQTAYGGDSYTAAVEAKLAALFEREVAVLPVATGTAANALALALYTPPYGAVFAHEEAHILADECGAPEMFSGGARLVPLPGVHGKLTPQTVEAAAAGALRGVVHRVQPAVLSLTQATEAGTLYTPDEIAALSAVARRHGLAVHMDGARFANAVVALGCSPADLTWRAGVDVLAFGATKNGCLAAEAVVLFDPARAAEAGFRRKRAGHLVSKQRLLSAQLDAYLAEDRWREAARHANAMARRLSDGLSVLPGVVLAHPVEANELFPFVPERVASGLEAQGFGFYRWDVRSPSTPAPPGHSDAVLLRLVTAFCTTAEEVEGFLAAARRLCGG